MAHRIVGQTIARLDGVEKVTGGVRYSGDVTLTGLCWGKALRSPLPSARILRIDECFPFADHSLCRAMHSDRASIGINMSSEPDLHNAGHFRERFKCLWFGLHDPYARNDFLISRWDMCPEIYEGVREDRCREEKDTAEETE